MLESQKDNAMQHNAATGSAILDTYLQFITENSFLNAGMGMTPEQAQAAIHAAKVAQKMAMERNFDKLPPGFFPPHLDISKITNQESGSKNLNLPNVTIEPTSNNSGHKSLNLSGNSGLDIRRGDNMDREEQQQQQQQNMMSINNNSSNNNNNNINSYNKEESSADERNLSDDESIAVN